MTDTITVPSEREAFEAYFGESRKNKGVGRQPTFQRFIDATYSEPSTQRHWWTWQQARAAPASPQPATVEPVAKLTVTHKAVSPEDERLNRAAKIATQFGGREVEDCWIFDQTSDIADMLDATPQQPAQPAGVVDDIERAARWVDARADAYDTDHGTTDPETGMREYPGDGLDYFAELREIADGIRALNLTVKP